MHNKLYWSQLITGIGIGLIIAALIWIFVPQIFPGLEDSLSQGEEKQKGEPVAAIKQENQNLLSTEGKYSYLFEDQSTQLQVADTNPEETIPGSGEEENRFSQLTNLAQKSDELLEESSELISSFTMNKENKASGEEQVALTKITQLAEINQNKKEELSTSFVSTQSVEDLVAEVKLELEQIDSQQIEEDSMVERAEGEVTEEPSTQDLEKLDGLSENVDEKVATVSNSIEEETDVPVLTESSSSEPEVVTLADLKVYEVEIEYGDTAKDVAKKLEQFGLAHRKDFLKLISLQKLERNLKVGKYYIKPETSLVEIIDELTNN